MGSQLGATGWREAGWYGILGVNAGAMLQVQVRQMVGIQQVYPALSSSSFHWFYVNLILKVQQVKDGSSNPPQHGWKAWHRHLLGTSNAPTAATSSRGCGFAVLIRAGSHAGTAQAFKGQ